MTKDQKIIRAKVGVLVPVHSSETPSFAYAAIGIRPI